MTYRSKGELGDEVIYFLAREIYKGKSDQPVKFKSWNECFENHAGCTLTEYMKYAKENKLKDKYINERNKN